VKKTLHQLLNIREKSAQERKGKPRRKNYIVLLRKMRTKRRYLQKEKYGKKRLLKSGPKEREKLKSKETKERAAYA